MITFSRAAVFITAVGLLAQQPPASDKHAGIEAVVVIANRQSDVSGRIARYYALKRNLPADHICWLQTKPDETITRQVFEAEIEKPVRECLLSRGLSEGTLYLVTTKGVPLTVKGSYNGLKAEQASTDSELTLLYPKIRGVKVSVVGPLPNPFFRQTQTPFTHPGFAMYMVTRLDAFDFDDVKRIIDRSLEAERTPGEHGKIYLDMKEGSEENGESWLRDAVVPLPAHRAVLDQTETVLYDQKDALGYASWGSNDWNHQRRRLGFRWLPGAIATEFVSSNGRTFTKPPPNWYPSHGFNDPRAWFAGSPQSLTADFIADGATGATGHVAEPYLTFTPRPDILFPAYLGGKNLAEAFYASIPALSWTNIIIGDPLCHLK